MTATTVTDRIEKTVILKAPRSRIWRALSDATQFGEWFKVKLDGEFRAWRHDSRHDYLPGL